MGPVYKRRKLCLSTTIKTRIKSALFTKQGCVEIPHKSPNRQRIKQRDIQTPLTRRVEFTVQAKIPVP